MALNGYRNSVCHVIEKPNYTAVRLRVKVAVTNDVRRIAMDILWPTGEPREDATVESIVTAVNNSCHYSE